MSAAGTVLQLSESLPVPMHHSLSQPELSYSPPQLSPTRALQMSLALNVRSTHFMSSVDARRPTCIPAGPEPSRALSLFCHGRTSGP